MIVKFIKPGTSFKGVMLYLMHDAGHASTSDRVAWTDTFNLAHDHIESAVHEMYTTCLDADLLKEEAGIRQGGSKVEKPVKHVSLNWDPSETPDREEMTRAARWFLKHMGWSQHQAILTAHQDKEHRHVHLVVNAIHPETGLKLDDGFEKVRAQKWALAYEQERGKIFCEERLKPAAERELSEPRPAWMAIRDQVERELFAEQARNEYDPSYIARADNRLVIERREWEILKELQKGERLAFIAEGKQVYGAASRAIYREVREEFRPQWAQYYAAKSHGLDFTVLAETRTDLIARQKAVIEDRREPAMAELRAARDLEYRALLDAQKEQRGELIDRQDRGLSSPFLLDRTYPSEQPEQASEAARIADALDRFGIRRGRDTEAAEERAEERRPGVFAEARPRDDVSFAGGPDNPPLHPSRDLASGLAGGLLAIIGGISESVMGGHTKPEKPPVEIDALDRFGIRRGRSPPPNAEQEQAKRDREEREAWDAWKAKRELDRSRSGW